MYVNVYASILSRSSCKYRATSDASHCGSCRLLSTGALAWMPAMIFLTVLSRQAACFSCSSFSGSSAALTVLCTSRASRRSPRSPPPAAPGGCSAGLVAKLNPSGVFATCLQASVNFCFFLGGFSFIDWTSLLTACSSLSNLDIISSLPESRPPNPGSLFVLHLEIDVPCDLAGSEET
eukprot:CAMPEP_0118938104 /NCGR_PEP_ID=MMETSP1169-20130426/24769_1 /TAXON_ID=36882 /ORGANISM="Pyramimonas obovata, Strain CCMP722" /LENGTH=177 /DNA_ID=CAMNT_0006881941 /DNA_START=81 /DNA_END=615 /DNA_ORIENTATION=-